MCIRDRPKTGESLPDGGVVNVELPQAQVEQIVPAVESTIVSEQLPTDSSNNNAVVQANDDAQTSATTVVATPEPANEQTAVNIKDDTVELKGDDIYLREVKRVIKEDAENPEKEEEDAETIQVDYMANHFGVKMKREEHK